MVLGCSSQTALQPVPNSPTAQESVVGEAQPSATPGVPTLELAVTSPTNTQSLTRTAPPSTATVAPTEGEIVADAELLSPNQAYVAKLYGEYRHPSGRPTIEVVNSEGVLIWSVEYQGELPTGDPRRSLTIYRWSDDSERLYFYYSFRYDGYPTLWDGFDLQVLSIASGKIWRVLPGQGMMAFAFSPNERKIAFARQDDEPKQVVVKDLQSGEETAIPVERIASGYVQVGWFTWSPDSRHLLYYTENQEEIEVIAVDTRSWVQRKILHYFTEDIWFDSWVSDDVVRYLTDLNTGEMTDVDVSTGARIVAGTATPKP